MHAAQASAPISHLADLVSALTLTQAMEWKSAAEQRTWIESALLDPLGIPSDATTMRQIESKLFSMLTELPAGMTAPVQALHSDTPAINMEWADALLRAADPVNSEQYRSAYAAKARILAAHIRRNYQTA